MILFLISAWWISNDSNFESERIYDPTHIGSTKKNFGSTRILI